MMSEFRKPCRPRNSDGVQAREALLKAAREVMSEQGQSGLTLREVAWRAGVQAPLVNYYFGDRSGLRVAVLEQLADELGARAQAAVAHGTSGEEKVRRLILNLAQTAGSEREALRLLFERVIFADNDVTDHFVEKFARPNMNLVMSAIASGVEAGEFREVDPKFFGPNLMGAVLFFFIATPMIRRIFGFEDTSSEAIEQFATQTAELILNGIRAHQEVEP